LQLIAISAPVIILGSSVGGFGPFWPDLDPPSEKTGSGSGFDLRVQNPPDLEKIQNAAVLSGLVKS
jgi:hypothetical protein